MAGEPLDAVYQRLLGRGIACSTAPLDVELKGYGTIKAVIFEDPDGNLIELIQLPSREEVRSHRARHGV